MMAGSKAQRTLETSTYTTVCYFVCAMTALPMALIAGNEIFAFEQKEWLILLGLILGAQLLGHTMFNSALKRVSPAIVSLIVFFEVPVSAVLIGCVLVVTRTKGVKSD
jgi:drug/metabolite transporter (DMT)-like permease